MKAVRLALVTAAVLTAPLLGRTAHAATPTHAPFTFTNEYGANRYATAANNNAAAFPGGVATVVLADATPRHQSDVLAAAGFAGINGLGVLLTDNTASVPTETLTALRDLGVQNVVALGGPATVPAAQVTELTAAGYRVLQPFQGVNGYATMQDIDDSIAPSSVGTSGGLRTAILASGDAAHLIDATAAAGFAYGEHFPVITTPTDSPTLGTNAQNVIATLGIQKLIVVGGTASIPSSQYDPAPAGIISVDTSATIGGDQSATSALLANDASTNYGFDSPLTSVILATGASDALSSGPLGGITKSVTILTDSPTAIGSAGAFATNHASTLDPGYLDSGQLATTGLAGQFVTDASIAPADPPTNVTVTSSDNPGVINTPLTYTVTVSSVAIPSTTGQIEVSDNGTVICGPSNGTYNADGTYSLTCPVTYATTGSHTIVGLFSGDQEFAQSAGSLTEVVNATQTTTTTTTSGGGGGGGAPSPPPAPVIALSVATDTPAYTQSATNYLDITYHATASSTSNGSPSSTQAGTVTFYNGTTPTCSVSVGSASSDASCDITYTQFGNESLTIGYSDGQGDTTTTGAQTFDIEPPPITVQSVWGTTAPTNHPTATVNQIGSSASVVLSDGNFEGATSVGITDNLGDTCTAGVGNAGANCTMTTTGTLTSLTLSYPGGTTTTGTQSVAPNGTQTVTTEWPAESSITVSGSALQVSVQTATVAWTNWAVQGGSSGTSNPPNPINTSVGDYVHLFASVTGNVAPDTSPCDVGVATANQAPCGSLAFTITQISGTASTPTQISEDAGSSDCSGVQNFSGQAEGGCDIVFNGTGSWQVSVEYVSADTNYASTKNPIVITVNVG